MKGNKNGFWQTILWLTRTAIRAFKYFHLADSLVDFYWRELLMLLIDCIL